MYIHIYACIHLHICTYIYISVYRNKYTYIYVHTHTHTCLRSRVLQHPRFSVPQVAVADDDDKVSRGHGKTSVENMWEFPNIRSPNVDTKWQGSYYADTHKNQEGLPLYGKSHFSKP